MRRRDFLLSAGTMTALGALPAFGQTEPSLLETARQLAAEPYRRHRTPLPEPFAGLDYDAYRGIRPVPGRAAMLEHGTDFALDLLPPGLFFPDPVRIDRQLAGEAREYPFSLDLFSFDERYFDTLPDTAPGAGFSGLRLRHPLNDPDIMDEVLVVQGASYFRAIGRAMAYGLSARAVAIGTGGASPEEFPRFVHLRLHEPKGQTVRIEGVIDSPSLAAHLDMTLEPGTDTRMDICATILPRRDIDDVGIAPLTSMYLKGPLRASVSDDFRPRVHDSDMLLIDNGAGERIWRPISNPARLQTSAFVDNNLTAFGLYQTARTYSDFEDAEARYHDRPSAVVTPRGNWGPGAVVLVEIPTGDEFMDNIVAFWRPRETLDAGSEHRFDYALTWTLKPPTEDGRPLVLQSRSGREHDKPGTRRYVVDIAGEAQGRTADITAQGEAEISGISLFDLPGQRRTRITFLLAPGDVDAVDLRLAVRQAKSGAIGPVWLHRWTRARDGGV